MYPYPNESVFECSKTFLIVFMGLILMTAGFCLTMAGWFAPPNGFVWGARYAGLTTLLVGLVILVCSCLMCAVLQRKCCACCYEYLDRRKARRKRESAQQIVTNPHNPLIFNDMQDSFADSCNRTQAEYYFDTSASTKGRGNGYFKGENIKVSGLSDRDEDESYCVVVKNDSAMEGSPISKPLFKVKVKQLLENDVENISETDFAMDCDMVHVNPACSSSRRTPGRSRKAAERRSQSASPSRRRKHYSGHAHSDSEKVMGPYPSANGRCMAEMERRKIDSNAYVTDENGAEDNRYMVHKSAEQKALERELIRREQEFISKGHDHYQNKSIISNEEHVLQEQDDSYSGRSLEEVGHQNKGNSDTQSMSRIAQDERFQPNGMQGFREQRVTVNGQQVQNRYKKTHNYPHSHSTTPSPKLSIRSANQKIVLPKPGLFRERDPNRQRPREQRRRTYSVGESPPSSLTPQGTERNRHGVPDQTLHQSECFLHKSPPSYADAVVQLSKV